MKKIVAAGLLIAALHGSALMALPLPGAPTPDEETSGMRIVITSVYVEDQAKALDFYTRVLGFVKKSEIPDIRWLTVVSRKDPDGVELLLEPLDNPAAKTFQKVLFDQGIPFTFFGVEDAEAEYERLSKLGVVFRVKPTKTGAVTIAVFEDTCGNLIQIAQRRR